MPNPSMQETVILLNGQSQYDVLRHFITDLSEAFAVIGYDPVVIDLTDKTWPKALERALNEKKVSAFLSMNAIGIDLKIGQNSLFDQLNIPLFAFLVDHPMYHIARLTTGVNNLIVSCVDKTHLEFLNTYMKGRYTKVFIPHGAPPGPLDENAAPIRERDIDLLITGTYSDPDGIRQAWASLSPAIARIFDEIMEIALIPDGRTLTEIATNVLRDRNVDEEYMQHPKFWFILEQVDRYIRAFRRKQFVIWLAKAPLRVELCGNGWEKLRLSGSRISLRPPVNFKTAQELMRQSKIVATVLPNFVAGGHERIFTSMAAGAVSLADANRYLTEQFEDRHDLLLYRFEESSVAETLELIRDPDQLQFIADNGRAKARQSHTWVNRAQTIADTIIRHRFFLT